MDAEIQTCNQLPEEELVIVALRLTFGGAPGPYEWGVISDSIYDLSIEIMHDAGWYPTSLCVPNGHIVPPPLLLDYSIPFAEGKYLIIDVPVGARCTADVYIDNKIVLTVDVKDSNNAQRIEQATLLSIHCAAQGKHNDEPIPRELTAS